MSYVRVKKWLFPGAWNVGVMKVGMCSSAEDLGRFSRLKRLCGLFRPIVTLCVPRRAGLSILKQATLQPCNVKTAKLNSFAGTD